jgi:hypothetical protein
MSINAKCNTYYKIENMHTLLISIRFYAICVYTKIEEYVQTAYLRSILCTSSIICYTS